MESPVQYKKYCDASRIPVALFYEVTFENVLIDKPVFLDKLDCVLDAFKHYHVNSNDQLHSMRRWKIKDQSGDFRPIKELEPPGKVEFTKTHLLKWEMNY